MTNNLTKTAIALLCVLISLAATAQDNKDARYLEGADKMDFDRAFEEAIIDCFNKKPEVIKLNICAFYEGKKAVQF